MLVIIQVATGSKEQGMFAGLAIGSTVLLEAMFAGPICGASMNPIRSFHLPLSQDTSSICGYICLLQCLALLWQSGAGNLLRANKNYGKF